MNSFLSTLTSLVPATPLMWCYHLEPYLTKARLPRAIIIAVQFFLEGLALRWDGSATGGQIFMNFLESQTARSPDWRNPDPQISRLPNSQIPKLPDWILPPKPIQIARSPGSKPPSPRLLPSEEGGCRVYGVTPRRPPGPGGAEGGGEGAEGERGGGRVEGYLVVLFQPFGESLLLCCACRLWCCGLLSSWRVCCCYAAVLCMCGAWESIQLFHAARMLSLFVRVGVSACAFSH